MTTLTTRAAPGAIHVDATRLAAPHRAALLHAARLATAVLRRTPSLGAATLAVVTLAGACAPPPEDDQGSPGAVAVTNATIIDGTGGAPIADGVVVAEGGRIVAVGPAAQVAVPDGATIVDAAGGAVMPGLADTHVHMVGGWDGVSTEMLGYRRYLNALLHAGVTTVFDAGNVLPFIQQIQAEIEAGRLPGPRVYMAGPLVDGPVPIWPPSGSPEARITAEDRLTTYRAARSALSVVLLDLAGPCRESGKTGLEWRDSRARFRRFAGGPRSPASLVPGKRCHPGSDAALWSAAPRFSKCRAPRHAAIGRHRPTARVPTGSEAVSARSRSISGEPTRRRFASDRRSLLSER